jgi:aspartyl-tRNA synthetase
MEKRVFVEEAAKRIGERVKVAGWVHSRRDHGKLVFIDLRDRSGLLQVVFRNPSGPREENLGSLGDDPATLRSEWVIAVEGEVRLRPPAMVNPKIATGTVELLADRLSVISRSETPPFELSDEAIMRNVDEETRLRYRYLDLRRPDFFTRLKARHETIAFIRNFLSDRGFLEIETPILTKSTPEGARDFIVPSRLHKGMFYALPQSPQQYKQLLMVAGVERYFQIARCFRDEDTRGDRQPEFTQLDVEMSFVEQEDILRLIEELLTDLVRTLFPEKHFSETPWPRIDYEVAIKTYGTDRPDLRKDRNDPHELAFAWILNFPLFEEELHDGHYAPSHHMFTAPRPEDIAKLETDPASVRSLQHDLVLNGFEIGGGSIRIHDPKLQRKIFSLIGFTDEEASHFEHMLTAFRYGVPPHGGIAPGIDRILMILLNQPNIREVIAFPKTGDGRDLMMEAPAQVSDSQLEEVGLCLRKRREKNDE